MLSGVTAELLKLLFPTSVEEITRKAAEQREAALLSGRAAASDIAAGLALGKAVAPVFSGARRRGRHEDRGRHAGAVGRRSRTPPRRAARSPGRAWRRRPARRCSRSSARCKAWMMTPTDIVNERPGAAALDVLRPRCSRSWPR